MKPVENTTNITFGPTRGRSGLRYNIVTITPCHHTRCEQRHTCTGFKGYTNSMLQICLLIGCQENV